MKRKIFLLSLVAAVLTLAIAGCQREGCTDPKATNYDSDAKKDNGTCVYAQSEPQPTEPTKVITIDWNWVTPVWSQLNKDTISYYAAQNDVKTIILNLDNNAIHETTGYSSAAISSNKSPYEFHRACDSLQKRFNVSPKIMGSGTIFVSNTGGGQMPDPSADGVTGMALEDSIRFTNMNYDIERRR